MVTRGERSSATYRHARNPLTDCVVDLAGMPDDSSQLDACLVSIARLTADLVAAVSYASVTARRQGAYTTVAASSQIAVAVDEAQYAEQSGPCLETLDVGSITAVGDIGATMLWPGFRDTAFALGLRASLSIPLFAGRGDCVAALNLYGHDRATMAALTAAVWSTYEAEHVSAGPDADLDTGGTDLVAGLAGAFDIRALIQQAVGVVIADRDGSADTAYLVLRTRAAESGKSLLDTARSVIAERHG